jgi:hypothetical protein
MVTNQAYLPVVALAAATLGAASADERGSRDAQRAHTVFWQVALMSQSVTVKVVQVAGATQSSGYIVSSGNRRQGPPTGECTCPLQM